MFRPWSIAGIALLVVSCFAADQTTFVPLLPCSSDAKDAAGCNPSKKDLKDAQAAYSRGAKLRSSKRLDEAFVEFKDAARLSPRNINYMTAREMTRQQLVFDHIERGNSALVNRRPVEAMAEFRSAVSLDPQNQFAQQRLQDAMAEWSPKQSSSVRVLEDSPEIHVAPSAARAEFHYRGDARTMLSQVASAYGITATFDDSAVSRPVTFNLGSADFYTAMTAACTVSKTFWVPLSDKQILIAGDTTENRRSFGRMSMRKFYIPSATSPQEMNDVTNMLRNLFDIRLVTPQAQASTLVVRAPQDVLDAATRLLETMEGSRPQVVLDVRVYQISHSLMRNMGLTIPNNFQLFNIPAGALVALGGQNIQDLINQLISGGGINQANNQAISALLAQLQNQQNSIFSQPLATFGNGLTFFGLSLGTAAAQLSLNENWVRTLEHATFRVAQGNDATFHIGSRYPVLNATFAPIFNTAAISQVLQNNSFQAPFPSFNYEDIGLSMKAKPSISGNTDVGLNLEMQLRTLQGQSINGVPVISNREYKGSINLKNGEPAVVAGSVSHSETLSMNGIPGLGTVPALNKVLVNNAKTETEDELMLVITPMVVSRDTRQSTEIYLPR